MPHRNRVAMIVASNLATDTRVQKTAITVSSLGYDVTVIWTARESSVPVYGTLGDVRTVGVPLLGKLPPKTATFRKALQAFRLPDPSKHTNAQVRSERSFSHYILSTLWFPWVVFARFINWLLSAFWWRWNRWLLRPSRTHHWSAILPGLKRLESAMYSEVVAAKPDIIHVHDAHVLGVANKLKRSLRRQRRNVAVIYDAHEFVAGTAANQTSRRESWARFERAMIPLVDSIITVSKPIALALVEHHQLRSTPAVVLNTPSRLDRPQSSRAIRTDCGLSEATPLLVYSGGVAPQRGVGEIVSALTEIPEAHLAIVAVPSVDSPHLLPIRDLAQELGLVDRVHYLNPVPGEEIIDFLSSATIGIHPLKSGPANHEMALPNKLFDYIHAGLPVVVSDVALMSEFVLEHQIGTVFASGDSSSLADAVRRALAGSENYSKHARNPQLLDDYSWEAQVPILKKVYASVRSQAR